MRDGKGKSEPICSRMVLLLMYKVFNDSELIRVEGFTRTRGRLLKCDEINIYPVASEGFAFISSERAYSYISSKTTQWLLLRVFCIGPRS